MASRVWWGEKRVPIGSTSRWRIGPLSLWVHRREGEWRVAREEDDDASDAPTEIAVPEGDDNLWSRAGVLRYALGATHDDAITLTPRLADRAVVAKPERRLFIPPDTDMSVYVSSPLWVSLSVSGRELASFPVQTPWETWFGPSPREGELCWATRTACRLRWDDGTYRPHRALTAVRVQNRAHQAMPFDKIKIPVNLLGLYVAPDGTLWSQDVMLETAADGTLAPLQIQQGPPGTVGGLTIVSDPRDQPTERTLARAIGAWLPH